MKSVPIAQFITVGGVVQGVGFRPFVYTLALKHGLNGWVRNTSAGVEIHAEGTPELIRAFVEGLQQEPPPLARIDSLTLHESAFEAHTVFEIRES
ncbi:partial acylphosphatase, partial [Anaerolineae bacterium]